ncbi:MAG: hypothetical protein NC203_00495 [Firmicutes bacterium]|nr:hypothetical protein [[Eubacterium] siraeum]MCM1486818.1 hypothetical protein [Bacillota bacterium]
MNKHTFIREKSFSRYGCRFMQADWYEYSEEEQDSVRKARRRKARASPPKTKKLNDNYSRKYFEWLVQNNFTEKDYHLTLTFADAPQSREEGKRKLDNFIRRARRLYKKKGAVFRYIYVQEGRTGGKRLHYHIIVSGEGVGREEVEGLWHEGYANADRLQIDNTGLESLIHYLTKSQKNAEKNERSWNCSKNMIRPDETVDDDRITKRRMRKLIEAARNNEVEAYLRSVYKGWNVIDHDIGENPVTGRPYARLKLMRTGSG